MNYQINKMESSDWEQVSQIYRQGIETGVATFQTEIPTWENWNHSHIDVCRFVARSGNTLLGWAAVSPTSRRAAYAGVVEVSLYIAEQHKGRGIGSALLQELIKQSELYGFWTLQSVIIRENTASVALHKKCGFREVGIRKKIAKLPDGKWHDTILLERRSENAGVD